MYDEDEALLAASRSKQGRRNYRHEMDEIALAERKDRRARLLLHSCCAPCSSYCLETLLPYFDLTVFYYNPNITDPEEYVRRSEEQRRLIAALGGDLGYHPADGASGMGPGAALYTEEGWRVDFVEGDYTPERFLAVAKGYEDCEEGGMRCLRCFRLRLREAAAYAAAQGYDYYTTTLTISPLKNAALLNALGEEQGAAASVAFLPSDFKKKGGYQRSVELSAKYGLYRQNYCGCAYSKREAMARRDRAKTSGEGTDTGIAKDWETQA